MSWSNIEEYPDKKPSDMSIRRPPMQLTNSITAPGYLKSACSYSKLKSRCLFILPPTNPTTASITAARSTSCNSSWPERCNQKMRLSDAGVPRPLNRVTALASSTVGSPWLCRIRAGMDTWCSRWLVADTKARNESRAPIGAQG